MRRSDCPNLQTYLREAMACEFAFYLHGERTGLMDTAVSEAEDLLDRLESRLSLYIENSDTNRINRARTGETIRISEDTVDCLLGAFDASARLNGKFHPFMGQAAIDAKGQAAEVSRFLPLGRAATGTAEPVLGLDPENGVATKLIEGPLLDLGGIGKGYALDRLAAHFKQWDYPVGLLESAGSTFIALGAPEEADGWELDIGFKDSVRTVRLAEGQALASSGEAFQTAHVIDPATLDSPRGWHRSYAQSASGALADAASTASLLSTEAELRKVVESDDLISFALYSDERDVYLGSFFA